MPSGPYLPAITVGFVPGVTPGKWAGTWSERHRNADLTIVPTDALVAADSVRSGDLDACFLRLPIDKVGLSVVSLYAEVPMVVVPKDHPAAAYDQLAITDLAGERLLQSAEDVPEWQKAFGDAEGAWIGAEHRPDTVEAAFDLVAAGIGVVIVPQSLARLHHRKDLVHRPVTDVAPSQVGIVWREGDESASVEEFVGIVRGRTANSSRANPTPPKERPTKPKAPQKAKPKKATRRRPRQGR